MTVAPLHHDTIYQAQHADPQALTAIYERYAPEIYRYIYYRVGDAELARDLQADVFVRMLEGIDRYEERGWSIGAWLYSIANARTVDCLRRSGHYATATLDPEALAVAGPDELLDQSNACAVVSRAMAQLNERHRQVLLLRTSYGLSLDETARQLGCSVGAIKSLQHRALERLRTLVTAELALEEDD
ncbi:MAG: RNA polymerase sigma factor [Oscillochloridaceae bacterium umkhey_bin13]